MNVLCMHVCMYVCMYVCMCVYMCVCMCVCVCMLQSVILYLQWAATSWTIYGARPKGTGCARPVMHLCLLLWLYSHIFYPYPILFAIDPLASAYLLVATRFSLSLCYWHRIILQLFLDCSQLWHVVTIIGYAVSPVYSHMSRKVYVYIEATCTLMSLSPAFPSVKQLPKHYHAAICSPKILQKHLLVGGFNPSEKYESQLGSLLPTYGNI